MKNGYDLISKYDENEFYSTKEELIKNL